MVVLLGGEGDNGDVKPSSVQDPRLVPQPSERHQGWQVHAGFVQRAGQQDPRGPRTTQEDTCPPWTPTLLGVWAFLALEIISGKLLGNSRKY